MNLFNSTNRAAFGGSPCPLYYIVVVGQTKNLPGLGIDILTWLFKTRSKTKVWPLIFTIEERRAAALDFGRTQATTSLYALKLLIVNIKL